MPARVDGAVKEGLCKLVDGAVAAGWAHTRACHVLGVADVRVHRWRARLRARGTLVDLVSDCARASTDGQALLAAVHDAGNEGRAATDDRLCATCGAAIPRTRHGNARYCSAACRQRAGRRRSQTQRR